MSSRGGKLAPEVNRALFVKNLSYNVTPEELFDLFGKFGPIRQVRQGIAGNTKGTAFVVYEDVMDAKQACDKLNGFNFQNRYLVGALQKKMPSSSAGRSSSSSSSSSTSSEIKTILRKDRSPAKATLSSGHTPSNRAVRFAEGLRAALPSFA
ncbi:pre-mRNA branch site protein p14 [Trichoderma barbatum]